MVSYLVPCLNFCMCAGHVQCVHSVGSVKTLYRDQVPCPLWWRQEYKLRCHHPSLQHACGYEYTSRLQRMLVDMKLSSDCMTEFHEHLKSHGSPLSIGFTALVLQFAAWPLSRMQCGFAIPEELATAINKVNTVVECLSVFCLLILTCTKTGETYVMVGLASHYTNTFQRIRILCMDVICSYRQSNTV